jgi:HSP20 family protein
MTNQTPEPVNKSHSFRDLATQFGEPVGCLRFVIDRLLDDSGKPARSVFGFGPRGLAPVPALEPVDDEKSYRLAAELPGLAEKDVEIIVVDDVLSTAGGKKVEEERIDNPQRRLLAANPDPRRHRSGPRLGPFQGRCADRHPDEG